MSQIMYTDEPVDFKSIDEAIEKFVELRDFMSIETKKYNELEAGIKGELEKISMWLRDQGDRLGVDNFKTAHGTAFRHVKTSYRIGDWESYIRWIKETGNFQCLEKRAAKLAVKEIHDVTGIVPPGLDYSAEVEFQVRRPTKSTKE